MNMRQIFTTISFAVLGIAFGAQAEVSPYITRVLDFRPAPGQFVNQMPESGLGETQESVNAKVLELIGNNAGGMVSLGGFGGYVVFGFDHSIVNVPGEYDFQIAGNAFYDASTKEGSCEPGIVMVSSDVNGNGLADDTWYELAGSEYSHPTTQHGYTITYYKGNDTASQGYRWESNDVKIDSVSGLLLRNNFHQQSYWPAWIADTTLTFSGTKLRNNGWNKGSDATPYFVTTPFAWGYVDNLKNDDPDNHGFNIEWAVDNEGVPVELKTIDFVKVYTALNQQLGWLGETSVEISNAYDLHPEAQASITDVATVRTIASVQYFNLQGQSANHPFPGTNIVVRHYTDGTTATTKVLF